MLEKIKNALRIDGSEHDDELNDLINTAKADLILSGVHKDKVKDTDPLIIRAIIVYCKAHFGYDDMSEKFNNAYMSIKQHLTLSMEYTEVDVNEQLP